MASTEELFNEYKREHRAGGEADPIAYLGRADADDRTELAHLIDAYLARSPGRDWDPDAYRNSAAEEVAQRVGRSLLGASGMWPSILPQLRHRAELTRGQVVERLSAALGFAGREQKVAGYYHGMEQGSLDSRGVKQQVVDALADIYGASSEFLREIGEPLGSGASPAAEGAMARTVSPDPAYIAKTGEHVGEQRVEPVAPAQRDEIDEMFTGGS